MFFLFHGFRTLEIQDNCSVRKHIGNRRGSCTQANILLGEHHFEPKDISNANVGFRREEDILLESGHFWRSREQLWRIQEVEERRKGEEFISRLTSRCANTDSSGRK
jgi:hypothetical protein